MAQDLQQMVDEVRDGLERALRVRGRSLDAQIRKAGRLLPRAVRRDATYLAQAFALNDNPKLAKMIDLPKARRAHRDVLAYLETVDPAARRKTATLSLAASLAFVLVVTGILVLFVLVQRGFL